MSTNSFRINWKNHYFLHNGDLLWLSITWKTDSGNLYIISVVKRRNQNNTNINYSCSFFSSNSGSVSSYHYSIIKVIAVPYIILYRSPVTRFQIDKFLTFGRLVSFLSCIINSKICFYKETLFTDLGCRAATDIIDRVHIITVLMSHLSVFEQ